MNNLKTFQQAKAIEAKNKIKLLEVCPTLNDGCGIYVLLREENGIKYGYVGQSVHILTRLAQHLVGYQHIDLSLKKHKFYSKDNPTGYYIKFKNFPKEELDEKENFYVQYYANLGVQLRNKTGGSQHENKFGIADNKPTKGYRDGIKQGYKNCQKEISKLFEKNLTYSISGTPNKNKEKSYEKFTNFLNGEEL